MARIDGVLAKIKRAEKHIDDLDSFIVSFCRGIDGSKPYEIGSKHNRIEKLDHTSIFIKSVKSVPEDDIACLIGDAAHNLRSALDYLMCQLVEAGQGTINSMTGFPIAYRTQEGKTTVSRGKVNGISTRAQEILSQVQLNASTEETLGYIHELDRNAKHRFTIKATLVDEWRGITLDALGGQGCGRTFIPVVAGYEIMNISTSTYERIPHENLQLRLNIAFREPGILRGEPVVETLRQMLDCVVAIVGQFDVCLS